MHYQSEPAILYFGTPVVLISTINENGLPNLAPISSVFWLGWRCVIGMAAHSCTTLNLLRNRECVLNLPSENEVDAVNALALTTGSIKVPDRKLARGYRYEPDKFGRAGLTPVVSETVLPPRVKECPVQLEAVVEQVMPLSENDESLKGRIISFELRIQRVHLEESIIMPGYPNRVDPDKWRPLIMNFQQFYGLSGRLAESVLATVPESSYRSPDVDRSTQMKRAV